MGRFLDRFPKVPYDINKNGYSNYENVTNLTFRFSIIKDVLKNTTAYYEYAIKEDETPEILADKIYGDPEAYWIILYANDIYDPQYDWPMNQDVFEKYVASKYGSVAAAKTTVHHYEKIIARQVENSDVIYLERQQVDYNARNDLICTIDKTTANLNVAFIGQTVNQINPSTNNFSFIGTLSNIDIANSNLTIAVQQGKIQNYLNLVDDNLNILCQVVDNTQKDIDYYLNLPVTPQVVSYVINNKNVNEVISRGVVTNYEHEMEMNDSKRLIKVIKKEFYGKIMNEFMGITRFLPSFYRKLK